MTSSKQNQRGFGTLESLLVVVIVGLVVFVGWYVYHAQQNSNKALDAATSTSNNATPAFGSTKKSTVASGSSDTSNASLQSDLNSASSSSNQGSQDLSNTNNSLGDQSTLTTVPQ